MHEVEKLYTTDSSYLLMCKTDIMCEFVKLQGACAVWYNLKANGEGDYMTRHAACPVLTGSKWGM